MCFIDSILGGFMLNTKEKILRQAEKEIDRKYPIFKEEKVLE